MTQARDRLGGLEARRTNRPANARPSAPLLTVTAAVALAIGGAAVCPAAEGTAQPDPNEPAVFEQRPSLHLAATDLFLELESGFESRRVRYSSSARPGATYQNEDQRFSQTLGMRLDGYILDPNFLQLSGGIALGLSQERSREDAGPSTQTDSGSGFLSEYDLTLEGWRNRPVSMSAYARSVRDRVPRRFLPSLLEERVETGVSLLALTGDWTTEVGLSWSDIDRTGTDPQDDEHLRSRRLFIDSRGPIDEHQNLRLSFDHQRDNSEYQGSLQDYDTSRDELRLEHEWDLGEHRLDTFARINEESGDLARDEFEFVPRLTLKHSDTFQTIHRYSYYKYEQDEIEWDRHRVDTEAIYRPSDRWRFTGDVFISREETSDDLIVNQYGGSVDVSYNRPTVWGDLGMNAALAFDRAEHEGTANAGLIRGEMHVLHTVQPVYLRELDVQRFSIVAYNAARTRIFQPGADYSIVALGRRIALFRIISGAIAENEPVFFDYQYEIPLHAKVDTVRADLDMEHRFENGLRPYYALELRRQYTEDSTRLEYEPDETERHRFGVEYAKPLWSASAEAEIYHDSVLPYDAYHLAGRAALLRAGDHSVDSAVRLSRYLFKADIDSRHVWWFNAELGDRMQLTPECSGALAAVYRYESDSIDGETNGVDLQGGLRFRRGYLQVELTAEYDLLSLADSREEGYGIWLNVRRDLSHLIPDWKITR
jgi:hypothetical protein